MMHKVACIKNIESTEFCTAVLVHWMFPLSREKMLLSCQQASCIDDHFPQLISPLSHLNSTKEQQKVRIIKEE